LKMSVEDLLLREPGEVEKRDQAMLETRFLLKFLKGPGKRRRRRRNRKNDKEEEENKRAKRITTKD
jgi:hypothetical protein